jgi:hypothetical protein
VVWRLLVHHPLAVLVHQDRAVPIREEHVRVWPEHEAVMGRRVLERGLRRRPMAPLLGLWGVLTGRDPAPGSREPAVPTRAVLRRDRRVNRLMVPPVEDFRSRRIHRPKMERQDGEGADGGGVVGVVRREIMEAGIVNFLRLCLGKT